MTVPLLREDIMFLVEEVVISYTKMFDIVIVSRLDAVTVKIIVKSLRLFLTVDIVTLVTINNEGVVLSVMAVTVRELIVMMQFPHRTPLGMSRVTATHRTGTEVTKLGRNKVLIGGGLHRMIDARQWKNVPVNNGLTLIVASQLAEVVTTDQEVKVLTKPTVLRRSKSQVRRNRN